MKFFMISSRTDLFIHSNILQYYSNPHKQHTEKDFYRIFQTKKAEADRSLSPAASAFTYNISVNIFSKKAFIVPLIEIYLKRTDTNFLYHHIILHFHHKTYLLMYLLQSHLRLLMYLLQSHLRLLPELLLSQNLRLHNRSVHYNPHESIHSRIHLYCSAEFRLPHLKSDLHLHLHQNEDLILMTHNRYRISLLLLHHWLSALLPAWCCFRCRCCL